MLEHWKLNYRLCNRIRPVRLFWASPSSSVVKNPPAMQEIQELRVGSLGQEDPLEEGIGNPLQYSYLENPMDRGAWWATVHTVTKSWT